ncbi:MAG: serine/threonine protein kinase [Chitinispirillales bacterium]|jgi:serine/threonine protein kinase|nr:serine/threonine protein kinase [Chitinispirillales bacterium]
MENLQRQQQEPAILRMPIGQSGLVNPYNEQLTAMPAVGAKLGPHIIQEPIGEGGSAAVFKVWHEELETVRAIKILKKGYKSDARERFFTEAKILADIRHPNIVEIFDIGYMEHGEPYLVLEYVEGTSIKELIGGGRLPVAVALSIAYCVCQALHYAHLKSYTLYGKVYKGLIHRDIKPENVLVSKGGGVKLMDFGIARPSEVSLHTVGAKVMGTLVYLSPEQLNGGPLDHRSDIFSLGAVLYEMVTGARAYPQKTLAELVQKKTAGQYKPLSSYGVKFPPRLAQVIDKAMAIDPEERYAGAAEMAYGIYGVLREVSDLPYSDILAAYMRDPQSIFDWTDQPKAVIQQKESSVVNKDQGLGKLPWIIAAAAAGVAAAGIIALMLIH